MNHESSGILRYSPKLLGDHTSEKWWAVLNCDQAIGVYYRELYWLDHYKCHELQRPAWNSHVTIIRNEEPPEDRKRFWEAYDGEIVKFQTVPVVRDNGEYFWINVVCPRLTEIRLELGLTPLPLYDFHLSVGHIAKSTTQSAIS